MNIDHWGKDDGVYFDLTYFSGNSHLKSWLNSNCVANDWVKISDKFSYTILLALYNYSLGSGRFNTPLRNGTRFFGNTGYECYCAESHSNNCPRTVNWGELNYEYEFGGNIRKFIPMTITSAQVKDLEKALSTAFKHELDRGIIVSRGVPNSVLEVPSIGDITTNKFYTSTSYGGSDWCNLRGYQTKYVIRIPKGSKVLHLSGKTSNGNFLSFHDDREEEILLRKNSVFRTTNVKEILHPNSKTPVTLVYQDFLGYGFENNLKNRFLIGSPNYNAGTITTNK